MKYYILSYSTKEEEIGTSDFPQCEQIAYKILKEPNSVVNLNNENFPPFIPNLSLKLKEDAILTDAISPSNISAIGFIINNKIKNIFSEFNLLEHKYYNATVMDSKNTQHNYFWLHFKENRELFFKNIDYNKSHFHVTDLAFNKIEDIEIMSYNNYLENQKKLTFKYISASKLYLKEELVKRNYDLFYIRYLFLKPLISERLVQLLKLNNVTGLNIEKQNIL